VQAQRGRLLAALLGLGSACMDPAAGQSLRDRATGTQPSLHDDDLGSLQMPLLSTTCSIGATAMTALIADGETAVLRLRPTDGKITLNALTSAMAPCEVPSTGFTITLNAWGTSAPLGRTVILDYVNGLFLSSSTGTAQVAIDFTVASNGANDTLKIRGSDGDDSFRFGIGSLATISALNHNAGSGAGLDSLVDVTFKQIEKIIVAGLAGDDVISGAGGLGTTTPITTPLRLFGGDDNDTLTGGSGSDIIRGGLGNDTMDGVLGNDTIIMGGAGDGNDAANCTGVPTGIDTVDYSARTTTLVLSIDGTDNSGEFGENDTISADIVNVIAGSGDDAITVDPTSTVNHIVLGGPGDDSFTGSAAALDVFDGQTGDDICSGETTTMTYASRSTSIRVTVCDSGALDCSADNDDGDQTPTTVRKSGTVATAADDGMTTNGIVTIAALTGISAADVGRKIRLSGFQTPANDDSSNGYAISAWTTTTVTINVSGNASFDETSLTAASAPAGLTWSIVGAEKDNVTCAHVTGSAQADILTGDDRSNTLRGGAANDVLTGGPGDDDLYGEGGYDQLWGGEGTDHLVGGADDDALEGGDGDDALQGDAGNDSFTCDGRNQSGGSVDVAPGSGDSKDDFSAGDTGGSDCEL
jgi:Ca2+-binding RTX toxin-like protein